MDQRYARPSQEDTVEDGGSEGKFSKPRHRYAWLPMWSRKDIKWYWDVRLWAPLIIILVSLTMLLPRQKKAEPVAAEVPAVTTVPPETVPPTTVIVRDPEAEALARLADSVGANRSDNVKSVIMWVAINRCEDRGANGYGLTLEEEIARPNQWQSYDPDTVYSEGTYKLAEDVLALKRSNGLRPLDSDMLWFVLNDNGSITVRNQFKANGSQKWREKTVN